MTKKIFILCGHPNKDTLCGSIARAYDEGASKTGHETRLSFLSDIKFDPILHKGYKEIQELEPDLKKIQEDIKWADHIVIVYPNWFITMPALLKGFFDRMWLPGFAYHFNNGGLTWQKLLKDKSARVFITMDGYPLIERLFMGNYTNEISKGILGFAGISPVDITTIGPVKNFSKSDFDKWFEKVKNLGTLAK